jgi:plastocyanin
VNDLGASRHPAVDRRRVVVYLDSAPRRAFDDLRPGTARMDQRGEQFVPRVLAITVGTSVAFPNNDTTFHNVFSLSRARTFDLGRYRPGRTGSVRFDRPGIVPIFCDIHTHMSAYILVFSHPFFAVSDVNGRYRITGVPAGTYSLRVWSELGEAATRSVTVPEGGSVEADFEVSRQGP